MKAKEFITEESSSIFPYDEKRLANIMVMPELDQYYEFYRFMIAAACSPDAPSSDSHLNDKPAAVAYTLEDEKKLKHALKLMGKKGKWMASGEAKEPNDTSTISPIAKAKKNKYGV